MLNAEVRRGKDSQPMAKSETSLGKFFSVGVWWGRIMTLDNVKRKHFQLVTRCYFCNEMGETVDLLMLHCQWSQKLWDLIFSTLGVHLAMVGSVRNTLKAWTCMAIQRNGRKIWCALPYCIFCTIWKQMNRIAFDYQLLSLQIWMTSMLSVGVVQGSNLALAKVIKGIYLLVRQLE